MTAAERDLATATARIYNEGRLQVAAGLRALADRVEMMEPTESLKDLLPDFLANARDVIHAVTWDVANLSTDDLVRRATEAHLAARGQL